MQPFLQPKPRPSLRFAVQLGAGLLVPMWIAPALAQGVAAITPSPAMAPRDEREKLAPLVMAPAAAEAMRAEQTVNQLAWRESLKRMSEAEADDPSRALASYKRFFNERTMSPELGVEVGLKIAQLRLKLGDSQGALQTCEVLATKYADEPTAALLSLQKARVLMEGKQLAKASECVNEVMPELVALGPSRYREISDLLLQLVQANIDSGDADGKGRAQALCLDVEEVYLRWLKGGTLPHTWQMFKALQTKYQQSGGQERAEQLLPKAVNVLLLTKATPQNPEGADVSIMAARWMKQNGYAKEAKLLYAKVPEYGNTFGSGMVVLDQAKSLLDGGEQEVGQQLLRELSSRSSGRIQLIANVWLSQSLYGQGDLDGAQSVAKQALPMNAAAYQEGGDSTLYTVARDIYNRAGGWKTQPIQTDTKEVVFQSNHSQMNKPLYARFRIKTYGDKSITASVDNPNIQARVLPVNNWQHEGLNAQEEEMEVVVQSNSLKTYTDALLVLSSATRGKTTTVRVSLVEKSV